MGMEGVLRLYFGESNLPTPDYIKQAAVRAMDEGYTFYTENAGLPSLRRAIAENYRRLQRVELDPAGEIVVTASGVQALNVGIRCALDPGDEALVLTPAWPNGSSSVTMANAVGAADCRIRCAASATASISTRSKPPSRRALGCCSTLRLRTRWAGWRPKRSSGSCSNFARRHGLWLMADEVYDRLYYSGARLGDPVPSILRQATRDDAVMVVHSFSKSYCMTGWRVGWLVARRDARGQGHGVERIHHFARAQLRAEGRRNRPGAGRAGAAAACSSASAKTATSVWTRWAACPA